VKSCAQLRKIDIYRSSSTSASPFASSMTPMTAIARSSFPAKFNRSTIFCSTASCGPFLASRHPAREFVLPILIV
jgi:hypothetical protein